MNLRNQKGFTLIELVLVIVILGILAIAALPSFVDISSGADIASRDGVVGAIRAGLAIYKTNNLLRVGLPGCFPTTLGGGDGYASPTNRLFSTVVHNGIDDEVWYQANTTSYRWYNGYVDMPATHYTDYEYTPSSGLFIVVNDVQGN